MESLDEAVKRKILNQKDSLKKTLVTQFKGEKPFSKKSFTPEQKIWAVDNLGVMDEMALRRELGDISFEYTRFQINKLRNRRR
jgi:hypothetical protein